MEPYRTRITNLIHLSSILPGKSYLVDDLVTNLIMIARALWGVRRLLVASVRGKECRSLSKAGIDRNRYINEMLLILRDPTASKSLDLMRRRSFHSSRRI